MIGLGNQAVPWQWRKAGGVWTPASVADLALWYRGDDEDCAFGAGPVYETIPNAAETTLPLGATGAARPPVVAVNGRNAADLDGTNHYMVSSGSKTPLRCLHNGTCLLYLVYVARSTSGYQHILDTQRGASSWANGLLLRGLDDKIQLILGNNSGAYPVNLITAAFLASGTTYLVKARMAYGGGTEVQLWTNGTNRGTDSFGAAPAAGDPAYDLHVGARPIDGANKNECDFCELLAYSSIPSGDDQALIESYLDERWDWSP